MRLADHSCFQYRPSSFPTYQARGQASMLLFLSCAQKHLFHAFLLILLNEKLIVVLFCSLSACRRANDNPHMAYHSVSLAYEYFLAQRVLCLQIKSWLYLPPNDQRSSQRPVTL